MLNIIKTAAVAGVALSLGLANTAVAFEPGDWLVRAGASVADPKSDNNDVVSVDSATSYLQCQLHDDRYLVG